MEREDDNPGDLMVFLAGDDPPDPARIEASGLIPLMGSDPAHWIRGQLTAGPGGAGGWLLAFGQGRAVRYQPDRQRWRQYRSFWLGCDSGAIPGPSNLARPDMKPGRMITLGDQRPWVVPVAALAPQVRMLDDQGRWTLGRGVESSALFDWAERLKDEVWAPVNGAYLDYIQAGLDMERHREKLEQQKAPPDAVLERMIQKVGERRDAMTRALDGLDPDLTVDILAVNYRMNAAVADFLGLLVRDAATGLSTDWMVLDALVDGDGIRSARSDAALAADADADQKKSG